MRGVSFGFLVRLLNLSARWVFSEFVSSNPIGVNDMDAGQLLDKLQVKTFSKTECPSSGVQYKHFNSTASFLAE
jgi:hypothetical protein